MRIQKAYIYSTLLIFSCSGLAKLSSDASNPALLLRDPFLHFLRTSELLLIVAILEIIVVIFIWSAMHTAPRRAIKASLWLSALFLLYRIGFALAPDRPDSCKCFGVGFIAGIDTKKLDALGFYLLLYLIVAGVILLFKRDIFSHELKRSVVLLSVVLFLNRTSADASEFSPVYQASGTLTWRTHGPDGREGASGDFEFLVERDKEKSWRIQIRGPDPAWQIPTLQHASFDGSDIYEISYASQRLEESPLAERGYRKVPNAPLDQGSHAGRVVRGPFPITHSSAVSVIWLAFFSGDHLPTDKETSRSIPNVLVPNGRNDLGVWACRFDYALERGDSNHLVKSARFIVDSSLIHTNDYVYWELNPPHNAGQREAFLHRASQLQKNAAQHLVSSKMMLESSRNYKGYLVPERFSAILYGLPTSLATNYFANVFYSLTLTNVSDDGGLTRGLLPPLRGNVTVEDQRFRVNDGVRYRQSVFYNATNKVWIVSTNDPQLVRLAERNPPSALKNTPPLIKYSNIVFLILIGLLVLPFFSLFKRARGARARAPDGRL